MSNEWRMKLQLMWVKYASAISVVVLPVALIRNGINPAAVMSSSGTYEQ
jgi:hypothetical protein